jgi:hypothetical protein
LSVAFRLKIYGSNLTIDVLIQEKQPVARQMQFKANKVTKTTHASDVQTERAKISENNRLLVYIADCGPAANDNISRERRTLVITAAQTDKCFGRFIAQLKRYCLPRSYFDLKVDI